VHVEFEAADELSVLSRAEVSVDAGPWQAIEPRGRLSDSKNESYSADFLLPFDPGFAAHREHLVSVRVWDRHDNAATARVMAAP
jgi:hypothetical protein